MGVPNELTDITNVFFQVINANEKVQAAYYKAFQKKFGYEANYFTLSKLLKEAPYPTLIIHDKNDEVASFEGAQMLQHSLKNARLFPTKNLGHSLQGRTVFKEILYFFNIKPSIYIQHIKTYTCPITKKRILPKLVNFACGLGPMMKQRAKVVPLAKGKVLEIGIGSGLNLSFYQKDQVKSLIGIDPSKETWALNKALTDKLGFDFQYIQNRGREKIPIDNKSIDTVVITYTLCTIPSTMGALAEIKRVLKPTGQILFVEHGKAPDTSVLKWQNRINPLWKKIGGGCNLNRDIPKIFMENGFKMNELQTMYLPGWKPASFNYWGIALPD